MRKIRLLLPSLHGIVICVMCLASVTWAFFSMSINNTGNIIKTAKYDVEIEISGSDSGFAKMEGYSLLVEEGKLYDVRIKAMGSAELFGGYCIVSAGDAIGHTGQMVPGKELEFSMFFPGTGSRYVEFIPNWGLYRLEISAGDEIGANKVFLRDASGGDTSDGDTESEYGGMRGKNE